MMAQLGRERKKMKRTLIAMALVCIPFAASADTLTITLTAPVGLCSGAGCSKTYSDVTATPPNVTIAKMIATYQKGCNASISGVCTSGQVLTFWADTIKNGIISDVSGFDQQILQQNAVSTYTPIAPK
jgi:hypothetical protein